MISEFCFHKIASAYIDIIKIKEFENFGIDTDYLATAMKNHGFGDAEIDVVNRILDRVGLSMQIVNQRR